MMERLGTILEGVGATIGDEVTPHPETTPCRTVVVCLGAGSPSPCVA
jgi:hypothetical protein